MRRVVLITILLFSFACTYGQLSITTQPASKTLCYNTGTSSYSPVTFNVVASGGSSYSYQWQESVDGGATFNNLSNGTVNGVTYSNVNTATLTLGGPTMKNANGYKYRSVVTCVSGCAGSINSNAATLSLPFNVSVTFDGPLCANRAVVFKSFITPSTAGLSYLWTFNDGQTDNQSQHSIPNSSVTQATGGPVVLLATNGSGCTVRLDTALKIEDIYSVSVPNSGPFCAGASVSLTANAPSGSDPLNFKWSGPNAVTNSCTQVVTCSSTPQTLAAGNYSYSVLVSNGKTGNDKCETTIPYTVNVAGAPTLVASNGSNSVCVNSNITLNNSTPGGNWATSDATIATVSNAGIVTGVSAGVVDILYTASNGTCASTVSKSITVNALPVATITYPSPLCQTGTATPVITGQAGGSFSASPAGLAINAATGVLDLATSTAGNYTVTYSFNNGTCASTATTNITVYVPPVASITYTGGPFCATGTKNVTLTGVTGGTFSSAAGLNIDATSGTIDLGASTPNTYTVSYTFTDGTCTVPVTTSVMINPLPATPTVSAGGPTTFCSGGSVTLTSSSASGNQWHFGGSPITGATNQNLTVSASGNYTVVVTDGNSCSSLASAATTVTVNLLPAQPTVSAGGPTTFCSGGSVVLSSSSASGNQWYLGGSPITGATNQNLTVSASGIYTVVVTDGNSCSSLASAATTVTVNPLPAQPTVSAGGPTTFCSGGSVVLSSSSASGNQWYLGGSPIAGATNQNLTVSVSGIYTVVVTDGNSCSSLASAATTVTVNPLPAQLTVSAGGPTTFCSGGSVVLSSSSASGNQWYLGGSPIAGATNQNLTVSASGIYTVVVTDGNSCSSLVSAATTVTVNPLPAQPTVSAGGPTIFCSGGSVVLSSSSASGNQWYLGGSPIAGVTNQNLTVSVSGIYTVVVTDGNSCSSLASAATTVTVNPLPAQPTVSAGGLTTFCSGGSVVLSSSSASGNQWYLGGSPIAGATNQNLTVSAPGNYTVVVTDGNSCSSLVSAGTTVTVNPLPAQPTVSAGGPTTFCSGGSVVLSSSSASGNQWYLGGSPIAGATNQNLTVSASGNYTVVVTDGNSCSSLASAPTTVVVNPLPATPTVSAGGPATFCSGDSVTLTSSSATGNQWYLNGGVIFGATSQSLIVYASGNYTVVVTDGNVCSSPASAATTVLVNPLPATPAVSAGGPVTFCSGGSVTLTSSSSTGNQWYLNGGAIIGATSQSLIVSAAGNYTVVVTDGNICSSPASAATTVIVNPLPATPVVSAGGPTTFCSGGSVTLTSSSATGNQWYLNGGTITGATSQNLMVSAPGNYTVIVTDGNVCSSPTSAATNGVVNPLPATPTVSAGGPTTFCSGGYVTLTSSSATGNQWYLNGGVITGANSQSLIVNTSGNYTVIVTDGNTCSSLSSAAATVVVNPLPATPTVSAGGSTTFCSGGSVTLTSSSATGNQWYLNNIAIVGATNASLTVSAAGNYTVVVTDGNTCSSLASSATTVVVNPLPVTPAVSAGGSTTFCSGGSVTLTSISATGNQWYLNGGAIFGATSQSLIVYASGTYTVVVTDGNVCSSLASAATTVVVNPLPAVPTITANGSTSFCIGNALTLTVSSATSYQWYLNGNFIPGATFQSISVTISGNYSVVVTDGNACASPQSAVTTITVNPLPTITSQPNATAQSVCVNNPALSVSATAAGSVLTFQWYSNTVASNSGGTPIPGATSSVFTPSSSQIGTKYFYVIITTDLGCSITSSVSGALTVNPLPVATISYPGTPFCATGTASVLHTGQGGGSYSAAPGLSINTATGQLNLGASVPGNYLITYSFSNPVTGCVNTTTTNIVVKPMPLAQINGTLSICATSNLSLTAADAGSGASYDWSGPFGFIVNGPVLNVNNVSSSSAGNYTLAVTISGCTSTASSVVTVKPLPVAFINGANSICEASSVILAASNAGAGATYAWAGPSGYNSNSQSIDLNAIPLSYNGIYTLTVTLNGCTSVATHNLLVKPLPVAQISGVNNICEASALQLTAADAGNTASYVWNGPGNFSATTNSIAINNVTAATAGTYGVIVTLNGCVASTSTSVIIRPLPIAQINGQTTICEKETLSLTATDAGSDAVYVWSYNNTQQSIQNNLTIPNAAPSKSGTYTLVVSRLGCSKQTTADVLVKPLPLATIIGNSVFCEASTLSLSAADAGNGAAYNWILPNNANIAAQNISLPNIQLIQAGSYTLITTKNGCMNSAVQTVAITPLPLAVINGVTTICESSPLNLIASDAGAGSNYTWLTPSGAIVNNRTLKIIQMALNSGGDYTLTVTKNGCQKQAAKTISIKPLANGTLTAVDALCETETLNLNASSPDPAATFSWTGPVNYAANGATTSIPNITPNYTGTFILGITKDGCTRYIDKAILVKPLPVTLINGKQALCEGTQLTLDAADAGATASYKWTRNQSVLGLNKQLILNNASLNDAGEYKLTVTLQGCSDETMKKVAVDKTPVVQIDPVNPVCQFYPSYVVTANELTGLAGKGEFSGTVISKDGTVNPARSGDYVINYKYTAANGCVTSQSKTIKIYPGVLVNAGVDKIQLNDEGTQLTSAITGKYNNLLWTNLTNPDASNPSPFVKPLNTTTYTISIQNEFGCMAKDEVVVKVIYLRIPNAFSPNADGTHDKWIIPDLQDFTNCQVEIFNRWGQRMFISKGYKEPWDGTVGGQPAATGTYYYIINLNDKPRKPFAGWLQLLR